MTKNLSTHQRQSYERPGARLVSEVVRDFLLATATRAPRNPGRFASVYNTRRAKLLKGRNTVSAIKESLRDARASNTAHTSSTHYTNS
jgi:hypothetical protein